MSRLVLESPLCAIRAEHGNPVVPDVLVHPTRDVDVEDRLG